MTIYPGFFPAQDTVNKQNVKVLALEAPNYQQAILAGGNYVSPPTIGEIWAIVAWDDNSLHVQTLDNLTQGYA